MEAVILFSLIIISIIMIASGFSSLHKSKTATEFFLMGGNLKLKPFIGTMIASNLSLGNMIFVCSIWGYYYGLSGAFWVAVTIILLILGYNIFAKYFKKYIEDRNNSGSLHDYIAGLYAKKGSVAHNKLRYFTSFVTILTLVLAIVLELQIASSLFDTVFKANSTGTTFVILTALIALYSCLGGFRTVVDTDILQSVFLFLAIIAGFYFVFTYETKPVTSIDVKTIFNGAGWANSIGISFLGFGWLLITMDTWQRNCASRSVDTSKKGILIAGSIMTLFVICFALFGVYVKDSIEPILVSNNVKTSNGLLAFNDFLQIEQYVTPTVLKMSIGIIFVGLIMAAISTADTFLIVLSHSLTTDLLISRATPNIGELNEKQNVFYGSIGRASIIVITFVIIGTWELLNFFKLLGDPLNLFYVTYSVQYSLLPALLFGIFLKKKSAITAIFSIIAGIIVNFFIGFYFLPKVQLADMNKYFFLRPDEWLGLLPFTIALSSAVVYLIVNIFNKK